MAKEKSLLLKEGFLIIAFLFSGDWTSAEGEEHRNGNDSGNIRDADEYSSGNSGSRSRDNRDCRASASLQEACPMMRYKLRRNSLGALGEQ